MLIKISTYLQEGLSFCFYKLKLCYGKHIALRWYNLYEVEFCRVKHMSLTRHNLYKVEFRRVKHMCLTRRNLCELEFRRMCLTRHNSCARENPPITRCIRYRAAWAGHQFISCLVSPLIDQTSSPLSTHNIHTPCPASAIRRPVP